VSIFKGANLVLRFLLELCALAALCYWGFKTGTGPISKVVLGIGAPLAAAVLWGTFVAPVSVPGALRLLLEPAVFGGAAAALYSAGRPGLAWALGLAYVINRVLIFVWDQ
jgi:hypothetical protein